MEEEGEKSRSSTFSLKKEKGDKRGGEQVFNHHSKEREGRDSGKRSGGAASVQQRRHGPRFPHDESRKPLKLLRNSNNNSPDSSSLHIQYSPDKGSSFRTTYGAVILDWDIATARLSCKLRLPKFQRYNWKDDTLFKTRTSTCEYTCKPACDDSLCETTPGPWRH